MWAISKLLQGESHLGRKFVRLNPSDVGEMREALVFRARNTRREKGDRDLPGSGELLSEEPMASGKRFVSDENEGRSQTIGLDGTRRNAEG
jgi:hypothetical protein